MADAFAETSRSPATTRISITIRRRPGPRAERLRARDRRRFSATARQLARRAGRAAYRGDVPGRLRDRRFPAPGAVADAQPRRARHPGPSAVRRQPMPTIRAMRCGSARPRSCVSRCCAGRIECARRGDRRALARRAIGLSRRPALHYPRLQFSRNGVDAMDTIAPELLTMVPRTIFSRRGFVVTSLAAGSRWRCSRCRPRRSRPTPRASRPAR